MLYLGYVLSCTWPNFLAIHGEASPPVFWLAAIASSIMNGGVGVAALDLLGRDTELCCYRVAFVRIHVRHRPRPQRGAEKPVDVAR